MSRIRALAAGLVFLAVGPLLLVFAESVPFLLASNLVVFALFALAATGLVLIMGFSGQVSLGHAAFYGIGAYSTAILTADAGWSPLLALLAGMVVSGLVAAVLGRAVFRLSGHFLAMATLAFGLFFFYLISFLDVTGGNGGRGGIPKLALGSFEVLTDERMFLLVWVLLGIGILVARNVVRSATGRALRATGSSEVAAACSGVNIVRAKVGVFVVGALYASLAGSLYAHWVTYIAPDAFGLLTSIEFLVIATVGGLGTVWGAVVGAAFVVGISELTREVVPLFVEGATGSYETVAYGAALILVLVVFHKGIADAVLDAVRRRSTSAPVVGEVDTTADSAAPAETGVQKQVR
ncbi:MAG: branched-chain amino acid ABC transporter permease [Actinomycetota bacterium]|nr:branched-chain amino acid ABC transporter permease [Actinomycetota bacterium]